MYNKYQPWTEAVASITKTKSVNDSFPTAMLSKMRLYNEFATLLVKVCWANVILSLNVQFSQFISN